MKSITVLRLNKILRKASALMAVLCLVTMLCGCSAGFFSGDLLTSPRLTDEAIAFYEQNKTEAAKEPAQNDTAVGNLRISFLDKDENGNWKATYELPAAGTEIESVAFSKLGSDEEKMIVSYSVLGSTDKILSVIDYKNGVAKQLGTIGYSSYTSPALAATVQRKTEV